MESLINKIKATDLKELFIFQEVARVYGKEAPIYQTMYEQKKKEYCIKYGKEFKDE